MLGLPVSFAFVLKVRLVLADCVALVNDTPVQQLQTGLDTLTAPPTGLEPAYSSYAFNDRLEDGDDTGARYVVVQSTPTRIRTET